MSKSYWLVKQEPESYSFDDFTGEGGTAWTGVRNFQARNNLRLMKPGDSVLFYHSGKEKAAVGIAEVSKAAYADPTASEGDWVAVDLKPVAKLSQPVELSTMRSDEALATLIILRQSQLSVMPVTKKEYDRIVKLGKSAKK